MRMKLVAGSTILLLAAAGCRFDRHRGDNGKSDDVKFATPFGGMSVKTDEKTTLGAVGITPYPGAVLNKNENGGHEDGAADVGGDGIVGAFELRGTADVVVGL